jgi:GNAT superfamily N-acetyltransferase
MEIRRLDGAEGRRLLRELAAVLVDCVAGGASVSFMAPFSRLEAEAFFRGVVEAVERGDRILLAAFIDSELVGTVQVITAMPPNQPHRGEIAKLLVLRSERGRGVGARLMEAAETAAWEAGKTLLVLDTETGSSGEKLYERLGWTRAGVIPNYALLPDGTPADTTFFWKAAARALHGFPQGL